MNLFPVSPYWNKNWLLLALAGGLLAIDASAACNFAFVSVTAVIADRRRVVVSVTWF